VLDEQITDFICTAKVRCESAHYNRKQQTPRHPAF